MSTSVDGGLVRYASPKKASPAVHRHIDWTDCRHRGDACCDACHVGEAQP